MDLEAFAWLLTDDGQVLLASATAAVEDGVDELALQRRLREQQEPARVAAALTQVTLRRRARAKFGEAAAGMYFTPDGLEQATRPAVARHRAGRLDAYGARTLADLGCGIGGDLTAAAAAGLTCVGVDLDPVTVAVARANLAALGLPGAVDVHDATTLDLAPFDVVLIDPARRTGSGRTFAVGDWTPAWTFVEEVLASRAACVKAAPGISHDLVPAGVEAEWVSDRGELKEAALWSGPLVTVARRATVIADGGLATLTDEDETIPRGPSAVRPLGRCLYEPDDAVIRAGLVTAVAAGVGGGLIDEHLAYVTSDDAFRSPFARGYEVLEELPYREKQLRAALRERGVGTLTVKKRGVDVVPEELRRRLDLRGEQEATLVLTRIAGKGTALLVRPF